MTDCLTGLFFLVGSVTTWQWVPNEPGRGLSEEEAKMLLELELLAETSAFAVSMINSWVLEPFLDLIWFC